MGTTAQKLKKLLDNKRAIRDAIAEKTGEDAGEVMSTYAEKIMAIEGGGTKYFRTTILLDQTITDPATMITKVYDDGGISQIRLNSHRYVCKLVDGVMQAKQLQDNNGTLYLDGTTADLTGGEGDVMMKLPEFYYRATEQETDKWLIDFAYGERPSEDYKHWDGKDFIGVYEAYVSSNNVYSRSGVASTANVSQANFKTYARNRGEGYTLVKWKHHCIMAFLFYAEYLNTNSQAICGAGTSAQKNSGQTDLLGMEDTSALTNGNSQSINFFGLENWWGNKYEIVDNVNVNPDSANGTFRIAEDVGMRDVSGAVINGYISRLSVGENLDITPSSNVVASATTGFCDSAIIGSNIGRALYRSGAGLDTIDGVCFIMDAATTYSSAVISSRLAYRGEYETFDGVFGAEYEVLEYFESDGASGFDTGFKQNQDTRVKMTVLPMSLNPSANAFLFGSTGTGADGKRKAVLYQKAFASWAVDYATDVNRQYFDAPPSGVWVIDYNKNSCILNDEVKAFAPSTFQASNSLWILSTNKIAPVSARLYSCQIYDNGTLVRDYVPCARKADGVRGLWDKVNKTFITPTSI